MRNLGYFLRRQIRAERLIPLLLFALVIAGFSFAFANLFANLRARNIASGFGYLSRPAGFEIGDTWISYSPQMSSARALLVGLVNTLVAGGATAVLITIIGLFAGLVIAFGGQSGQAGLRRYVALTRNVPLLLHVIAWYTVFRETLPPPRNALTFGSVVLSTRGLVLPVPREWGGSFELIVATASTIGFALGSRVLRRRWSRFWIAASVCGGILVWLSLVPMNAPVLRGFNYIGGWTVSVEFCALVLALGIYTGGYVTEIVRGSIESFPRGQVESAFAVGLSRAQFFLLVMTPQVVRGIAPAMVNQYVNVIKLTSLGIAIGYPDLVSVSNTEISQTGQAVEAIALILASYLVISLLVSLVSQRLFGDPIGRPAK